MGLVMLIYVAVVVLLLASGWVIFTKAGQPGWASLIPIYNAFIIIKIVGKPAWWIVLCLIPFVNLIIGIILCLELAKVFGKGGGFAVGLLLLPFIFAPMLAFGDATYTPPPAAA